MSVGLSGPVGLGVTPANMANIAVSSATAAAGSGLAQAAAQDTARSVQDVFVQQRSLEAAQQAEDAQGIGKTNGEDNRSNERDADGRSSWKIGRRAPDVQEDDEPPSDDADGEPADAEESGDEPGSHLDLSG
jgi:hypothetical protein